MKLSSAGLIYKHFGREIIQSELGTDEEQTEIIFQKVYTNFIEAIDGIDNGVNNYPDEIIPKYKVHTHLSARVGALNPWWNDSVTNVDERFKEAIEMTGKEFLESVQYYGKAWLPARRLVEKAIASRFDVDKSGEIIVFDCYCPWKEFLLELEPIMSVAIPIKYALFPDPNTTWRVQCVPKNDYNFENRKSLPWKGLRDEALSSKSGIPGGVFVHISGFIGGNKTKEGALAMARKGLESMDV